MPSDIDTLNQQDDKLKLRGLFMASCFILGFSLLNLLVANPIKSLIRNARASLLMGSREMESKDVPVPIDHMTRNDLGVEESIGESSYQFCIQWLFYFVAVSIAVKVNGPEAATRITFDGGLLFSSISGIFSLSMGQLKAHRLTTEYSTTSVQKILYFFAALASTVSTQLLLTNLLLALADLPGNVGFI